MFLGHRKARVASAWFLHDFAEDVISYSAGISSCERSQQWAAALALYTAMERQEVKADGISALADHQFVAVKTLGKIRQSGLVGVF